MDILKKPYEISIWQDKYIDSNNNEVLRANITNFKLGSQFDFLHPVIYEATNEELALAVINKMKFGIIPIIEIYDSFPATGGSFEMTIAFPTINDELFDIIRKKQENFYLKIFNDSNSGSNNTFYNIVFYHKMLY